MKNPSNPVKSILYVGKTAMFAGRDAIKIVINFAVHFPGVSILLILIMLWITFRSSPPAVEPSAKPILTPPAVEPSAKPILTPPAVEPSAKPIPTSPAVEPSAKPILTPPAVEPSAKPILTPPPVESPNTSITTKNTSRQISTSLWKWKVYLETSPETLSQISCVVYTLHPTFPNPIVQVCTPEDNFALQATGWGTFTIKVKVIFKDGRQENLEHQLQFE